jgi:nucleotide-binding universal stress UspA family protein
MAVDLTCGGEAARQLRKGTVVDAPILAAIDMSETSRVVLLWACKYAAMAQLPVTALHVVHDPAEAPGKYHYEANGSLWPISKVARKMLAEFLDRTQKECPGLEPLAKIEKVAVDGLPAHTIVNQARRLNASLIVMGSRNQSGLQRLMNGSIAQKVMQLSPTPVTIVKTPGL